eukprot:g4218.t1
MRLLSALLLGAAVHVQAHSRYQDEIPNGRNVVNSQNEPWPGVGHVRQGGGGARNAFGSDFAAAGFKWTKELCQKDSDCDGLTNGQELGDPDCEWQKGQTPKFDAAITHPGSAQARGGRLNPCRAFAFDAQKHTSIDLRFPPTRVLGEDGTPTRTTYFKFAFNVVDEFAKAGVDLTQEDYYAVMLEPIVNQSSVLHHIVMYGCSPQNPSLGPKGRPAAEFIASPHLGESMPCQQVEYAWAVGGKAFCTPGEHIGFPYTANSPWHILDLHYDNPQLHADVVDSSGVRLTVMRGADGPNGKITPAGMGWMGAVNVVEVPPGKTNYHIEATCDGSNIQGAQYLTAPVNFFAFLPHGHTITRQIYMERYTNGQYVHDAGCDTQYDFDLQEMLAFNKEFPATKADSFKTHCVYDSTSRTTVTKGGDGTDDEMCLMIFAYYPLNPAGLQCIAGKNKVRVIPHEQHTCNDPGDAVTDAAAAVDASQEARVGDGGGVGADNTKCSVERAPPGWMVTHGAVMLVAWGVVLPAGAALPVFFKQALPRGLWFKSHMAMQLLGVGLAVAAAVVAVANAGVKIDSAHTRLGAVLVVLALLQPIGGLLRPHVEPGAKPPAQSPSRRAWLWGHRVVGLVLLLGAWANLFLGAELIGDHATGAEQDKARKPFKAGAGVCVGVGALLYAGGVLYACTRRGQPLLEPSNKASSDSAIELSNPTATRQSGGNDATGVL